MAVIKIVPMPGAKGDKGDEGATGAQGPQGPIGATGPAGADAAWYYNGEYNPGASYVVGDVVTYDGQTWYRKNANGGNVGDTPSVGPFWDLIAAKGESADIGVHEHLANVFPNGLVVEGYISDPEVNPAGTMSLSVQDGYTALMDMVAQSAVFNGDVQITNLNGTRNTTIDTPVNVNNNLTTTEDATINNLTVGRGSGNNEFNTAVGQDALLNNTAEAFANTAIGKRSMKDNTSGNWNTAVGSHTLRSNTTGGNNVAVGNSGLEYNTTGTDNTAVGGYSSVHNTSGVHNTAIGAHSFVYNTEGIHNTVVGSSSLTNNIDGDRNTAIGADTLHNNNGSYNTAIGNAALASSTSSNYNTAVGNLSLEKNNGAANTALGDSAGRNNVNGERNIFIGYNAGLNETGSDKLYIDVNATSTPLIYGDFAQNKLTFNGDVTVNGYSNTDGAVGNSLKVHGITKDTMGTMYVGASDSIVITANNGEFLNDPNIPNNQIATIGDIENAISQSGSLTYKSGAIPATHHGVAGDTKNDIKYDDTHMYICVADYTDGSAAIWKRINWASGNW